jgi:cell division control protein 12
MSNSMVEKTIGISNLPHQLHRIVSRKGGILNLMIVGGCGLGKTTFINTLFETNLKEHLGIPAGKTAGISVIRAGFFIILII